jgi:hypothetical protein
MDGEPEAGHEVYNSKINTVSRLVALEVLIDNDYAFFA